MQIIKKFIDYNVLQHLYNDLTVIAERCRYESATVELDLLSDIYDQIREKFHEIEQLRRELNDINEGKRP